MKTSLIKEQEKAEMASILGKFIRSNPDARELKRALAVKMALEEKPYSEIAKLLEVNKSFVSHWKQRFYEKGLEGIKLGYLGAKSFLTAEERLEVIDWLQTRNYWNLDELMTHLEINYDVIYQSKQSYYNLFSEAGISWKKSQKINPKSDPECVKKKREEIQEFIRANQAEIDSGELVVLFLDECHLCWGDACGYVWGKSDIRIEIPILNQRDRQTYFGALNYQTREFILHEYSAGNGENTVDFMKYLQSKYPGKRIVLIWDGAAYHKSKNVRDFLASVNEGRNDAEWQITCILFAPNSPVQNPVEDVWLQGKNFLRGVWHLLKSFPAVKWLFNFFLNHQKFDFSKIDQYSPCSILI